MEKATRDPIQTKIKMQQLLSNKVPLKNQMVLMVIRDEKTMTVNFQKFLNRKTIRTIIITNLK